MNKLIRMLLWGSVGVIGGKVINDIVHSVIYAPGEGINTTKALLAAIVGMTFTVYCVYRALIGFGTYKKLTITTDTENSDQLLTQKSTAKPEKRDVKTFGLIFLACVVVLTVVVLFFSIQRTATSVATSRDASVPQASTGVTNAKVVFFESAVCSDKTAKEQWSEAVPACTTAANRGDADAQFNLGLMYAAGIGVAQNYSQAVRWFTLAAEQGLSRAQYFLGTSYYEGQGNTKDYVRAHMWFNLAAVSGTADSAENRDNVARKMTREQIAKAQQMATDCVAKNYKGC